MKKDCFCFVGKEKQSKVCSSCVRGTPSGELPMPFSANHFNQFNSPISNLIEDQTKSKPRKLKRNATKDRQTKAQATIRRLQTPGGTSLPEQWQ